jgi:hypothetical protein
LCKIRKSTHNIGYGQEIQQGDIDSGRKKRSLGNEKLNKSDKNA